MSGKSWLADKEFFNLRFLNGGHASNVIFIFCGSFLSSLLSASVSVFKQ